MGFVNSSDMKYTDTRPSKGMGVPMISLVTAQEMRTCLGDDSFNGDINACIAEIQQDFVKPELECVMETVGPKGEMLNLFDGRL